jgi:hypothetical protein
MTVCLKDFEFRDNRNVLAEVEVRLKKYNSLLIPAIKYLLSKPMIARALTEPLTFSICLTLNRFDL